VAEKEVAKAKLKKRSSKKNTKGSGKRGRPINILNKVLQNTAGVAEINAGGENVRPNAVLPNSAVSLKPEAQLLLPLAGHRRVG